MGVVAGGRLGGTLERIGLAAHHVDVAGGEDRAELLEGQDEIDVLAAGFGALGDTGSDEHGLERRVLLLHDLARVDHRTRRERNLVDELRHVLGDEIDPGGAAARRHDHLRILLVALDELRRLVARRLLGAERDFHHFGEAGLLAGGEQLLDRAGELLRGRGGDHRDELLALLHREENLHQLRALHHRAERTLVEALAAEDALLEVDLRDAELVLLDRADGTGVLARHGRLDDRVVGTRRHALAALDAERLVDDAASADDRDRLLRTVVHAGSREAAAAVLGRDDLRVRTARAGRSAHRKRRHLVLEPGIRVLAFGDVADDVVKIRRERLRLVALVLDRIAEKRHQAVLQHRAVVVDAASRARLVLRTELHGDVVDLVPERSRVKGAHEADCQFATDVLGGLIHLTGPPFQEARGRGPSPCPASHSPASPYR